MAPSLGDFYQYLTGTPNYYKIANDAVDENYKRAAAEAALRNTNSEVAAREAAIAKQQRDQQLQDDALAEYQRIYDQFGTDSPSRYTQELLKAQARNGNLEAARALYGHDPELERQKLEAEIAATNALANYRTRPPKESAQKVELLYNREDPTKTVTVRNADEKAEAYDNHYVPYDQLSIQAQALIDRPKKPASSSSGIYEWLFGGDKPASPSTAPASEGVTISREERVRQLADQIKARLRNGGR